MVNGEERNRSLVIFIFHKTSLLLISTKFMATWHIHSKSSQSKAAITHINSTYLALGPFSEIRQISPPPYTLPNDYESHIKVTFVSNNTRKPPSRFRVKSLSLMSLGQPTMHANVEMPKNIVEEIRTTEICLNAVWGDGVFGSFLLV